MKKAKTREHNTELLRINDTLYMYRQDSLYVQSESGDTLLPPYEGKWTFLEECYDYEEAVEAAHIWEENKPVEPKEKFYWTHHPESGHLYCIGTVEVFETIQDAIDLVNEEYMEDESGNQIFWTEDDIVIRDQNGEEIE